MHLQEKNGVQWLEFSLLQGIPGFVHGVFLRHGGVSSGPYTSLNVGENVGDLPEHVAVNLMRVKDALAIPHLIKSEQCHSDRVVWVEDLTTPIPTCDALATQTPGLGLLIRHADCQAALFVDPKRRAFVNVHAGWRGSKQRNYTKVLLFMREKLGSLPEDLLVGIGPSLGPDHAEFIHYKEELPEDFWPYQKKKNHFDFWAISYAELRAAGVLAQHIEMAEKCTYSHPEEFFSYRRDTLTGRHATLAAFL